MLRDKVCLERSAGIKLKSVNMINKVVTHVLTVPFPRNHLSLVTHPF
jgi:hypothetical protein